VATDAATAADAISATNPYTVAFLLHSRKSQIQTTDNEELSNGVKKNKKKRQYPPQSPKPPLSSSLTTQHKHLLTFHILFLLSLFSFSDQNRTPNQPGNSKKKKKQLKPK
jgi:hypothetical protein